MSLLTESNNFSSKNINKKRPKISQVTKIQKVLNFRDLWLFRVSILILIVSVISLCFRFVLDHTKQIPAAGGEYIEGLVGSPKYINPLYSSLNDVDADIGRLIYSSLFSRDKAGVLTPDLVTEYSIENEEKEYILTIRDDVYWHSGEKLTIDDIVYTFNLIKDATYQSPLRMSFSGVEIEKIGENKIKFILSAKYSGFLNLLDFGIMPQDMWYQADSSSFRLAELNLKPVGSGPYRFQSFAKDKSGTIKLFTLEANENYYGKVPYIDTLTFKFFSNYEEVLADLSNKNIDGISYLPVSAKKTLQAYESWNFYTMDLSQLTAIFFNSEKNVFLKNKKIREALALAIDKQVVIDELGGDYRVIDGPVLPSSDYYNDEINKYQYDKQKSLEILNGLDWELKKITEEELLVMQTKDETTQGPKEEGQVDDLKMTLGAGEWLTKKEEDKDVYLIVNLTTLNTDENIIVTKSIKDAWESIGVKTIINLVDPKDAQALIRERNFESLFYGIYLESAADLYTYWHSSREGVNGLNLAGYKNEEADTILNNIRQNTENNKVSEDYKKVQKLITDNIPAIFMYSPTYTYIQDKKIKGFSVDQIYTPYDRFSNVVDWYILTNKSFSWEK